MFSNSGWQLPTATADTTCMGCFAEQDDPVLPFNLLTNWPVTAANCAKNCIDYTHYATEAGGKCWCGNILPTLTGLLYISCNSP